MLEHVRKFIKIMKNRGNSRGEGDQHITIDDVKAIDSFKNLTDDQAEEIIEFVKAYCVLVHTAYQIQKLKQKNKVSNHLDESDNYEQAA